MSNDYKINIIHRDEYGRPSGIVALNKPKDITSHDLVDKLRKRLNTKKVGHAGALDVFADGVMIYLIGKATKLSDKSVSYTHLPFAGTCIVETSAYDFNHSSMCS